MHTGLSLTLLRSSTDIFGRLKAIISFVIEAPNEDEVGGGGGGGGGGCNVSISQILETRFSVFFGNSS